MSIRILIADDHAVVRQGLCSLLGQEPGMTVVGEVADGRSAVRLSTELAPDVVIMDITMPDMNGIEATHQIKTSSPGIKVVALSIHSDRRMVARMLAAGASAYLTKDSPFEELTRALRTVIGNQTYLSPPIADTVTKEYVRRLLKEDESSSPAPDLSEREREVLQLLAEGNSTKQVASELHVSDKTVETHRRQIMRKLNLHSLAELTKFAIREGLTSLEA
jgi:DNA-binding NarL/FixJ family response regulator